MFDTAKLDALKEQIANGNGIKRKRGRPAKSGNTGGTANNSGGTTDGNRLNGETSGSNSGGGSRGENQRTSDTGTHPTNTGRAENPTSGNANETRRVFGGVGVVRRVVGNDLDGTSDGSGNRGNSVGTRRTFGGDESNGETDRTESRTPRAIPIASITTPETKTTRGRKPKVDNSELKQIVLFGSHALFTGVGMLTKCAAWPLADDEAEAIAEPATRLLARYQTKFPKAFQNAAEYMEMIALGTNLFAAIAPRLAQTKMEMRTNGRNTVNKPVPQTQHSGKPATGDKPVEVTPERRFNTAKLANGEDAPGYITL